MHSKSLPLTLGGTVFKESDDLDIFGVTSSLGFQSSFSKACDLEELLTSISRFISPREMLSQFCPVSFGVQFISMALGCRYTH